MLLSWTGAGTVLGALRLLFREDGGGSGMNMGDLLLTECYGLLA